MPGDYRKTRVSGGAVAGARHELALGRGRGTVLPVPDRDTVSGYGLLGFAGSWRVRGGLTLRARLDNLTDRSYETFIGFPGPGRSFSVGLGWDRS